MSDRREIAMPNLGYDMDSGRVNAWVKQVGDHVARGETIAEIETDKTIIEMEALESGTIVEIVCPAGDEAAVGATIAYLQPDE